MARKTPRKSSRRASPKAARKVAARAPRRAPAKAARKPGKARKVPDGLGYVDGEVLDLARAKIPLNDRGYLLGDGVFETLRTVNGKVFRLDDHAARLRASLKSIGLDEPVEKEFRSAVQALTREGLKLYGGEVYLRVNISTGPMGDIAGADRGIMVTGLCRKFKPYPMQYYSNGVHVITSRQRKDSRSPLAAVKSLSFLPYVAARREALTATAHDAVLLNEHGRIVEASTSNIFARGKDDVVHAPGPSEGAVGGVTRTVLLELVEDAGFKVVEQLPVETLANAREAWLSNTTGGVVPVTRFDDRPIGSGNKGNLTAQLGHAFEALLRNGHA